MEFVDMLLKVSMLRLVFSSSYQALRIKKQFVLSPVVESKYLLKYSTLVHE